MPASEDNPTRHWALAVFDIRNRRIEIRDSLPRSKMFTTANNGHLMRMGTRIARSKEPWTIEVIQVPSQGTTVDCGVLTVINAVFRICNQKPQYTISSIRATCRATMARCLFAGSWRHAGTEKCMWPGRTPEKDHGGTNTTVTQHFWGDAGRPRRVPNMGALLDLEPQVQQLLPGALALTTIRRLRAAWTTLAEHADRTKSPAVAIVRAVEMLRTTRGWRATTAHGMLTSITSVLRRADQTLPSAPTETIRDILDSSLMIDYSRALRKRMAAETRTDLPRVTPDQFQEHLNHCVVPHRRVALILCWAHAARPSNVYRLKRRNVAIEGSLIRITWTEAKTVLTKGPYTTRSTIPGNLVNEVETYLSHLRPEDALFPAQTEMAFLQAVKQDVCGMDLRGFRRGALTTLAQAGASVQELMSLSGHSNPRNLQRYILYGEASLPTVLESEMTRRSLWTH